jgi:hypothetical protein
MLQGSWDKALLRNELRQFKPSADKKFSRELALVFCDKTGRHQVLPHS